MSAAKCGGLLPVGAGLLTLATAAAVLSGDPLLPLVAVALGAVALLLAHAPLRNAALLALGTALVVDSPSEHPAADLWRAPWARLGEILYENLNTSLHLSALHFALLDVLVVSGGVLALWRVAARPRPPTGPRSFALLLGLSMAWTTMGVLWGLVRGGDFQQALWQTRQLLYLPLLTLFFQIAFAPRDLRAVGAVVLAAAFFKALEGLYVLEVIAGPRGLSPPHVTTHSDTILFVTALTLLGVACYQWRDKVRWLLLLVGAPLLLTAIEINGRRVAYLGLAAAALAIFVLLPGSRLKRGLTRLALMALPLFVLYATAGWRSTSVAFAPLKAFRTVSAEKDRSVQLRDIEDYNLAYSLRHNPLLGSGFGHEYAELLVADDIARIFPQYKYIPHNSVMGLWALAGLLGFTALWLPIVAGVFLAMVSAKHARWPAHRTAAFTAVAVVIAFAALAWGDMGVQSTECVFLLAAALGIASRLAVETGAWPVAPRAAGLALAVAAP